MTLIEIVDLYNNKDIDSWRKIKEPITSAIELFEIKLESAGKHYDEQTDIRLKSLKKSYINQLMHSIAVLKNIKHDINNPDKIAALGRVIIPKKTINEKPTQGKLF